MLGALVGDVIGSVHEYAATKTTAFPLFPPDATYTDDSVLTVAVADWILSGRDLVDLLHEYTRAHPGRGYGTMYRRWAAERRREPYQSYGNGGAMRVSPVGFAFDTPEAVIERAAASAAVTHDHPEGIRGAQAAALAVFLARHGADRPEIRAQLATRLDYRLDGTLDDLRPRYAFTETAWGTVPPALIAVLESHDYESAVRNAISLGGDADTLACIAGGVAEALYGGVPAPMAQEARSRIDPRLLTVVDAFRDRFHLP